MSRSCRKAQASTTASYQFLSYSLPKRIFSFTVVFWIQAYCGQKALVAPMVTLPVVLRMSPARAASKEDLPEPTPPMIATSSLRPIEKSRSWILNGSVSVSVLALSTPLFEVSTGFPALAAAFSACLTSLDRLLLGGGPLFLFSGS